MRLWKTAECSESTGRIVTFFSLAAAVTIRPAQTRVSLLARATVFPASMAAMVGFKPAVPTMAETTVPASVSAAASITPSSPESTRQSRSFILAFKSAAAFSSDIATVFGRNFLACSSVSLTDFPAAMAATLMPRFSAHSSVWRPMEPVEPKTATLFVIAATPLK